MNYKHFLARVLYVNNPQKSIQSSWEERFAPVVDETSVRLFLTVSAMYHKHLPHLDIVCLCSCYTHGTPRNIILWGDEEGFVQQLFKAMNGVDSAAQVWNKHFHEFMEKEGFLRTSREACLYTHHYFSLKFVVC